MLRRRCAVLNELAARASSASPLAAPTTAKSGPAFRPDIQGLRAVAVLLVVASHIGISRLSGGYVGVDVFFVISGFLITSLLIKEATHRRGISLGDFYARRARRILPAATVVLLATVAGAFAFLGQVRTGEILRDTVWAALFSANWKFASDGTDYFAATLPPSPVQHYWSLGVEEQFYLLWPALLLVLLFTFAARRGHERGRYVQSPSPRRWALLGAVIGLLAAASLTYSVVFTKANPTGAYFSTLTRGWELAVGAMLAIGATQLSRIPGWVKATAGWIGLTGIGLSAVWFTEGTNFPGTAALLPVLSAALVIAGGVGGPASGAVALLGVGPMRWIGDRSYSLYLWHWPVLIIGAAYLGHDLTVLPAAGLVVLALGLTMATYTFVEHPIHQGARFASRGPSLLLWPASLAVISTVVVFALSTLSAGQAGTGLDTTSAASKEPGTAAADSVAAVAAAVAAAKAGGPVPNVLSPAIGHLRGDNWGQDAPCTAAPGKTTSSICSFGPGDAKKSMVLFGDSHAGMWLPPLRQVAEDTGWRVYYFLKVGCPSADVALKVLGSKGPECDDWRSWALAQIRKLTPDLVILANRGLYPLKGGSATAAIPARRLAIWQGGMVSTLRAVDRSAARVVVLSETPQGQQDPVACLDRPGASLADCTFKLARAVKDTNAASMRAVGLAGGTLIDLTDLFCSSAACPMVVDGVIVYYDIGHISRTYSLTLTANLEKALSLGGGRGGSSSPPARPTPKAPSKPAPTPSPGG